MTKHRSVSWVVVCLVAGCELFPTEPVDPSTAGDTGVETGAPSEETSGEQGGERGGGFSFSSHPCVGYRTDALWVDDVDTLWVGCGSTTDGYGLYRSIDGGRSWESPPTDPPSYFEGMRVSAISRSADGRLYVGGIHGAVQAVSLDTASEPMAVSEVFVSTSQVWDSFQVGGLLRNSRGLAVAESLTGTGLAFRPTDDAPFEDGSGWAGGESFQILDLALYDDRFYGVGSTISQPPTVYLPPPEGQQAGEPFQMIPIRLSDGAGELWGLAVDERGVAAVGVDQDLDRGRIFVSGADPSDLGAWRAIDVSTVAADQPSWMRGVCRRGETLLALGEYSQTGEGLILRSDDNGQTFADITPDEVEVPAVHRCEILDDGTAFLVGGEGFVAVWRP